jgi:hypothetical protein
MLEVQEHLVLRVVVHEARFLASEAAQDFQHLLARSIATRRTRIWNAHGVFPPTPRLELLQFHNFSAISSCTA